MLHLLLFLQDSADRGVVEDIGTTVEKVDQVQNPDFVFKMTLTLCITVVIVAFLFFRRHKK